MPSAKISIYTIASATIGNITTTTTPDRDSRARPHDRRARSHAGSHYAGTGYMEETGTM